jgi:hypothetical protein
MKVTKKNKLTVGGRMKQYHEIHLKKFRYENKTNNPTRK